MAEQVAVRTRFLDRALLAAAARECDQVVLLASGMDARAHRLTWPPGTTVFELDFADVLAFKAAVLDGRGATPACHRVEVATDLRQDWPRALTESGFSPRRPAAWLAEGILYALPPEAADLLLDRITAVSAPGSVLALDHAEDSELLRAARADISAELVGLWRGGPRREPGHLALQPRLAALRDGHRRGRGRLRTPDPTRVRPRPRRQRARLAGDGTPPMTSLTDGVPAIEIAARTGAVPMTTFPGQPWPGGRT
ncbi:SAM-dependent methyltransferase [Nonomuraea sp. NPDC050451]|uniref:SAM-dependent methyltransferase n=1 Tax=Nonomuraea sp. NPDC050451 TaxID=3364364 RepID=UPI0037A42AD2